MTKGRQPLEHPDIAVIRERWQGIDWRYAQNSLSPDYIGDAWIYQVGAEYRDSKTLLDLDEPKAYEVAFLRLAAEAPQDIRALLGEIERLQKALIDLVWGCENGNVRPYPAHENARRVLGNADPLRFICGPVEEE